MRHKILFVILLLVIVSFPQSSKGFKIQLHEKWDYEDNLKQIYNEMAIENIQMISNDDIVSVMEISTTRGFPFAYQKTIDLDVGVGGQIIFDLQPNDVGLYVTQEGGIALYPVGNISGRISATIDNETKSFPINSNDFVILDGDPSLALISTTSEVYSIQANLLLKEGDMTGLTAPSIFYDIHYRQDIIISTNNNPVDNIKNYTLTPILTNFEFNWLDYSSGPDKLFNVRYTETLTSVTQEIQTITDHWIETTQKSLHLLQTEIRPAQQYTYEDGIPFPTYIKQTEPVKTVGLSLSQDVQEIEYFLVRDNEQTSTSSTSSISTETSTKEKAFYPFIMIVALLLIRKKISIR